MKTSEKAFVREAKYGVLAALNALEMTGYDNPYVKGVLNMAVEDLRRALKEGE